jgi:chaperone modulatory protein CbpM
MTPNFILTFPVTTIRSDVMEESTEITLTELCRACNTEERMIVELVDEGVMEGISMQKSQATQEWRFSGIHLRQARIATRLQRDLGVNLEGAALAMQLLNEIDILRKQLSRMSR